MEWIIIGLFLAGFPLLIGGAELLVRGASRLAIAVGISPLVVGLTVVSFGTSAPELAVSIKSGIAGKANLAVGNVVGSNIANVLLILGVTATLAPLIVQKQLVRFDVPLMIVASFVMAFMGFDGTMSRIDGLLLTFGAIIYTVFVIQKSRKEGVTKMNAAKELVEKKPELNTLTLFKQLGSIVLGLVLLVVGADWLVAGAVYFATLLGVSELIIGLTVVAIGTSLPELATSIVAALRGERDIAVGNVIGSNIFNILFVLGVAGAVSPDGLPIDPIAIAFDIPVLLVVAVLCFPVFYSGYTISRLEGIAFFSLYISYLLYTIFFATQSSILSPFKIIMSGVLVIVSLIFIFRAGLSYFQTKRK